jgi:hypothetical protein
MLLNSKVSLPGYHPVDVALYRNSKSAILPLILVLLFPRTSFTISIYPDPQTALLGRIAVLTHGFQYDTSQPLPQPVPNLRLTELCQVIHALLTQINPLQLGNILRRRLANTLYDDRRICLEDNAVIDHFINGKGNEVVVLDDCAFVYRLPRCC